MSLTMYLLMPTSFTAMVTVEWLAAWNCRFYTPISLPVSFRPILIDLSSSLSDLKHS